MIQMYAQKDFFAKISALISSGHKLLNDSNIPHWAGTGIDRKKKAFTKGSFIHSLYMKVGNLFIFHNRKEGNNAAIFQSDGLLTVCESQGENKSRSVIGAEIHSRRFIVFEC